MRKERITQSTSEEGSEDAREKKSQLEHLREELSRTKEQGIAEGRLFYSEDGAFEYALAPNGEKSHLSEKQWLETRSSFFKSWFGDWEGAPEKASKFIDENGEPLVLYHGTTRKFDTFSHEAPKTFNFENVEGAFFLTSDRKLAETEYGKFKRNLIIDTLRIFNTKFFDGKATEWSVLIDKWNEFVRSIGTERVTMRKQVPDGRGEYFSYTMVEFDGKSIIPTDELEKLWDRKVPKSFNQQEYEVDNWEEKEILVPKNSKPIVMELFINSRNPNRKAVKKDDWLEVDGFFAQGMIEKGMYAYRESQQHIKEDPSFGSKSETDSIAIKLRDGQLAVAIFEPTQAKSANGNTGIFNRESSNIYE